MQPFGENASNIPAFLGKLWKMVNDPNTDHIICWSPAGNSFIIQNQAQFWYELLPLYYKHNNMSSFVRQLNMYGFHKMSTIENGTMDADKDEIQFYHSYFQKDQSELLKNIKRKVTTTKTEHTIQNIIKSDDIARVLSDVKQLRGRQSSVDSQLTAMKQENAVLWRELALLRQKHLKQQQIVNKLIQFLVTLVQPTANSRMGVGVKRRMPLMLHESPTKKSKVKKAHSENFDNGPTIHELDTEIPPDELFDQATDDEAVVSSPLTSATSPQTSESTKTPSVSSNDGNAENTENLLDDFWDKPEFIEVSHIAPNSMINDNDLVEESINTLQSNNDSVDNKEVFLNPITRDTLLSNLANGSYNSNIVTTKHGKKVKSASSTAKNLNTTSDKYPNNSDRTIATRNSKINNGTLGTNGSSRNDLDLHLENTQNEIDQLKEILQGCNTFDANALLGLFNEETPNYGLTLTTDQNDKDNTTANTIGGDPMVSGTELANYNSNVIDFNELFNDSLDGQDTFNEVPKRDNSTVNTPMIIKTEPFFPNINPDL